MKRTLPLLVVLPLLLLPPLTGWYQARAADPRHAPVVPQPPAWRGDIHHFQQRDVRVWRAGRWVHGRHDGRGGWWWVIGTTWYFYPAPVYPYPDPYVPPPAASLPPPPRYWYYCAGAAGYYPYVPTCPGGWTQVPAGGEPHDPAY